MTLGSLALNLGISVWFIVSMTSQPILGRFNCKETIWRYASHTSDPFYVWKQHFSRKSYGPSDTSLKIKNITFFTPRSPQENVSRSLDFSTINGNHAAISTRLVAICIGSINVRICQKQQRPGYYDVYFGIPINIKADSVIYPISKLIRFLF